MAEKSEQMKVLQEVRERTQEEIERLKEALQAEIEPAAATDEDSGEAAADVYERSRLISLIDSLQNKLRSVDHAMEMVRRGKYGICEMCGQMIPPERLEIVPETTLCVRCASRVEQGFRRYQLQQRNLAPARRRLVSDEEEDLYEEMEEEE